MKIVYIAEDGEQFDTEQMCKVYEFLMNDNQAGRFQMEVSRLLAELPYSLSHYDECKVAASLLRSFSTLGALINAASEACD